MTVVVDASAMGALVFQEPGWQDVARRLDGATVCAPPLLRFELANVAWKKARRRPLDGPTVFAALAAALDDRCGIVWRDVPATDVALLARVTGLTAYDASYLWLAGWLEADLVTLDKRLGMVHGASVEVELASPLP